MTIILECVRSILLVLLLAAYSCCSWLPLADRTVGASASDSCRFHRAVRQGTCVLDCATQMERRCNNSIMGSSDDVMNVEKGGVKGL